jgi:DNA repair exonuclease SbcCD ATPase subunit
MNDYTDALERERTALQARIRDLEAMLWETSERLTGRIGELEEFKHEHDKLLSTEDGLECLLCDLKALLEAAEAACSVPLPLEHGADVDTLVDLAALVEKIRSTRP